MDDAFSFLSPTGYQRSSCGYCHSKPKRTRAAVGAISSSVRPEHYQLLVDRGWRRSGTYYYKPDNRHHCCPHYTIRLDAAAFDSRKDQRKALNRWNQYIFGQDYRHKASRFCPDSREEKRRHRNTFDLHRTVHQAEYENIKRPVDTRTKNSIEPAHKFEVTLEPDNFTTEKYAVFKNYQKAVHNDESSPDGFKRFLCSGLGQKAIQVNGKEKRIGSYHQCYRLDDKLVAIGVLDLLPECVSSVYLMYHEIVKDWEFGKLSAMREIALALEDDYQYYYMGYYIHSCIKMRYKGAYRPTYLLDPISYSWDPLDSDLLQRLSARRFVSLVLERQLQLPADLSALAQHLETNAKSGFLGELQIGNVHYGKAINYVEGKDDGEGPPPTTVFQSGMPGAMSLEELDASFNLGEWLIQIGGQVVMCEDLIGWDGEVSEPGTIKGIVAELAACIGPELVKETILKF